MFTKIFICLCVPLSWGLIIPFTKPNGEVNLQELAHHMTSMEYLMQNMTSEILKLTSEISTMKQKQDTVVSFKASVSQTKAFSMGSTIIFDHVESNIGNGYNPTSGVFHAPISGIYTFSAQMEAADAGAADYALVSQGTQEIRLTITKPYDSRSMSAIFHVDKGNDVFVIKSYESGTNSRLRGGLWCQVSGHLLKAD